MYPTLVRQRYGRYYTIGTNWVRMIGHPQFMKFCVKYGFPRERLMRFAISVMANMAGDPGGGTGDKMMRALLRMVPEGSR